MHAGAANPKQYLVLLPSLAFTFSRPRQAIRPVSRTYDWQRWSPRRTIPQPIPKRYSNLTNSAPADQPVTKQDGGSVSSYSERLKFFALARYIFKLAAVSGQTHAKHQFFFQKTCWLERQPEQRKGGSTWETSTGKSHKCAPMHANKDRQR